MHIELTTIIVNDYDQAIEFYVNALEFELVDDSPSTTNDGRPKRWVVVRPPGSQTGVLLARADGDDQAQSVGTQFAGRVGMFLRVDDFDASFERMRRYGVEFVTEPRNETYGRIAVFRDIAGNRWDLLGPNPEHAARNGWDDAADGWDDDPIVRRYADAAHESLIDMLGERGIEIDGATVLDFGCGTGLLTERLVLAAASIDALDSSVSMLEAVRDKVDRHGWTHVQPLSELPIDATYDLIVASSVCAFLDDYPATVRRLASSLRPGGMFVQWDWERAEDSDDDGLSRSEISTALAQAGLGAIEVRPAFSVSFDGGEMAPLLGTGERQVAE